MLVWWRIILRILKKSNGPAVADTPAGRVQVDARQEGGKFGGGHPDATRRDGGDTEGPAFESLGPNGHTVAAPIQNLDPVAALVDEVKEMTGGGNERRLPDARAVRLSKLSTSSRWGWEAAIDEVRLGRKATTRKWLCAPAEVIVAGAGLRRLGLVQARS